MTNLELVEVEGNVNHYEGYDAYDTALSVQFNTLTNELTVGTIDREWTYEGVDFNEFVEGLESGQIHYWMEREDCQ